MRKTGLILMLAIGVAWVLWIGIGLRSKPQPAASPSTTNNAPAQVDPKKVVVTKAATAPSAADSATPAISAEMSVDDILRLDQPETIKAEHLLRLLGLTKGAAQEEVAQHLVNLLDDDHYASAESFYTNAETNPEVLGILMHDLLNRPESVKLPVALAVARVDNHPQREPALELLRLHIDHDHGTNWLEWQSAVEARLAAGSMENSPP
jgi:hypothetical protein